MLTQWTIISWDFTIRTTTLESQSTDPTKIILIFIIVVIECTTGTVRGGFGVVVEFVRFGRGVPFPGGYGVIGGDGEFHSKGKGGSYGTGTVLLTQLV